MRGDAAISILDFFFSTVSSFLIEYSPAIHPRRKSGPTMGQSCPKWKFHRGAAENGEKGFFVWRRDTAK